MLTFIGLGLYDERSITVEGREVLGEADRVFAEFYTSRLGGATVADLEDYHDVDIEVRDRAGVENDPEPVLSAAESGHAAFLTAGDPMISTTHVDLRLRAVGRDVDTRIVHGPSAGSAAASLTGLQNYRFGKATTLPLPSTRAGGASPGQASSPMCTEGSGQESGQADGPESGQADGPESGPATVPESVLETLRGNRDRGLHTLVYLDIDAERGAYLTADRGARLLEQNYGNVLGVVVCRAGSPDPVVAADRLAGLAGRDFGAPLHLLVVPGDLHHVELDALRELAGAPADVLEDR